MILPDFMIIGAMKCGTSTLQAQLAAQPGVFMTTPKEPNYFSDDPVFAKGADWYGALYDGAAPGDLKGEASTHYTKLPTYPDTLPRLEAALKATGAPDPRLIYMIRNPVARAVSHYIHEWTMGVMSGDIDAAFDRHPELISYSCYGQQIAPFVARFGADRIFVTSQEELRRAPQEVLTRTARFLGLPDTPVWKDDLGAMNVSAERIRRLPLHGLLVDNPVATVLRRTLVPQALRDRIRKSRQMDTRPELSDARRARLQETFAQDYARLREMFPGHDHLAASYPFVA